MLLREIHHRVKNNMQIVDSLLYLQAQTLRSRVDPLALEAFAQSQSRIKSMAAIHDRMPAIVPEDRWDAWLDPSNHDTAELQSILVPSGEELVIDRASTDVNNVRNNSPDLLRP